MGQHLHTYVDTDSLKAGDILTYTLVLDGAYSSVQFPGESSFESEFEFLSRERFQISQQRDSLVYRLQFFGTEPVTIGRKVVQLQYAGRDTVLYSTPVSLAFSSLLTEEDAEFRPLKPIFEFARNWLPLLLVLLLLALLFYYLAVKFRNRESEKHPEEPVKEPVLFLDPLDQLKETVSLLKGNNRPGSFVEFEQFYIELGDAIRLYLKRVYRINALEMTTREIIDSLRAELASSDIITITRKVLQEADMVKFANFLPGEELAHEALKKADQFVGTVSVTDYERIRYMKYQHEQSQQTVTGRTSEHEA